MVRASGAMRLSVVVCFAAILLASGHLAAADKPTPVHADVSYGPHPNQLLDVYVPPTGDGPFLVLVWFGGLWAPKKGPPDVHRFFRDGCAVIAIQSRVMQDGIEAKIDPPISVCLLDARRAVQFARFHAAEWKLDAARIAVGGGSQGALPALFVGCSVNGARPDSADPVERVSTRVVGVAAFRSQPTIDPKRMQEWVPGVEWGAPAFGCPFAESLARRDELMPAIATWSPDYLLQERSAPIYFENNWGLTQPEGVGRMDYLVHAPQWGLGFQKLAQAKGVECWVKYPGHPTEPYADTWDFLVRRLKGPAD